MVIRGRGGGRCAGGPRDLKDGPKLKGKGLRTGGPAQGEAGSRHSREATVRSKNVTRTRVWPLFSRNEREKEFRAPSTDAL